MGDETRRGERDDASLVIFDCDGVLVDSELLSSACYADALAREGYAVAPDAIVRRFIGMTRTAVRSAIEHEHGSRLPDDFDERVAAALRARYDTELRAIEGVADALDAIGAHAGRSVCVASSAGTAKLRHGLTATGLLTRFDGRVFSADAVSRGKPAPDLFLHAAGTVGVDPSDCIVVEDSPAGVQAGVAAGMTVLGFTGGSHRYPGLSDRLLDNGAALVFRDMRVLPRLLAGEPFGTVDPSRDGGVDPG